MLSYDSQFRLAILSNAISYYDVNLSKDKIESVLEGNFFFEEKIDSINDLFPGFDIVLDQEDIDCMKKNFTGIKKYNFNEKGYLIWKSD